MIPSTIHHTLIRTFSNTKDVRWAFIPPLANVDLHGSLGINWEALVWIDGNAEQTRVGVDQFILVPDNRVPEYAGII
jgi:hypothetical protein